jgi:hypothetical protein
VAQQFLALVSKELAATSSNSGKRVAYTAQNEQFICSNGITVPPRTSTAK